MGLTCRQFIAAEVRGVFSYAFVDFGDQFEVVDPNGEDPKASIIANITQVRSSIIHISRTPSLTHPSGRQSRLS